VRGKLGCDPRFETIGLRFAKAEVEDSHTGFSTKGNNVPGFALIDARDKPFWFGDGGSHSGGAVLVPRLDEPFNMARTLTTVAQYAQFVASGDYTSHFEGEGREWLDGSYNGPASDEDAVNWLARRPKQLRNQPYDWKAQLAYCLRPVVNVSWFEAQAYVRWLNASLAGYGFKGYQATLPTELQWECAARYSITGTASQRPFPWKEGPGTDADRLGFSNFANLDRNVDKTTTVGLYPQGLSESGLADMAGNVWEWIGHDYVENYDPSTPLALQRGTNYVSMRGGSWGSVASNARCSFRRAYHPDGWHDSIGFRVVLSLAN
jgi:formylglycine-generating enzyme required for sulfatase activity